MKTTLLSNFKIFFGLVAIVIALVFLILAAVQIDQSKIFREGYEIQEEFETINKIDFQDPEPLVDWMNAIEISQSDNDPLEIDQSIGIRVWIEVSDLPQDIVVHIFHEDMVDFFTGNTNSDYRNLAVELDRVPALKYSDMFNIKFDLEKVNEGKGKYALNGMESMTFKKAGKYFASVSIKTNDGLIDHYKSKTSVLKIDDPQEIWMESTLENLINVAEEQKADTIFAIGIALYGIAASLLFSGITLILSGFKKE